MRGYTDGGTYARSGAGARGSAGGSAGRSGGRPAAAGQGPVCHPKYSYFPESDPPNSTLVLLNMSSGNWRPSKAALFDLFRPYGYLTGGARGSCLIAHCYSANQLSSHGLLGFGCPAPGASALVTVERWRAACRKDACSRLHHPITIPPVPVFLSAVDMPPNKSCAFLKYTEVEAAQRALRALGGCVLPEVTGKQLAGSLTR